MKKLIVIFCLFFSTTAQGACENWTNTDTALEAAYLTLHFTDMRQTLDIKNHDGFYETNPALGKRPSDSAVINYFLATAVAHGLISCYLPEHRKVFMAATIFVEVGYIGHNYNLGLNWGL